MLHDGWDVRVRAGLWFVRIARREDGRGTVSERVSGGNCLGPKSRGLKRRPAALAARRSLASSLRSW
jgi:hypothetical protein